MEIGKKLNENKKSKKESEEKVEKVEKKEKEGEKGKVEEKAKEKTKGKGKKEEKEKKEGKKAEEKEVKEKEANVGEKEKIEEKIKQIKEEKETKIKTAEFDFQLETVTEPFVTEPVIIPKTKELKETATAREFNLEEFLQGVEIKGKKNEKEYVSKKDYSIDSYVQNQEAEKKYNDMTREWREAIIPRKEARDLFPTRTRRVRLREETTAATPKEMENVFETQERVEYEYKVPFEEKGDWHQKEKRIKKYEIIIS